jgi:protein SCO1/2/putative membrane protein
MTQRFFGAVFAVLCLLTLMATLGCQPGAPQDGGFELAAAADSPEVFGEVGPFDFEERRGGRVTNESLRGKPWLVAFIFTRCATICPALTQELSRAHGALEGLDFAVVAISVDPEHDTPEVLGEYAAHFEGGLADDWLFLRGTEEETHRFVRESFKLGISRLEGVEPGLAISHSSRICVVDGEGWVRGYYDGTQPEGTDQALRRMRFLARGITSATSPLPTVNAVLNSTAALLLVLGMIAIKRGRRERHALCMRAAFLVSVAFLVSYVTYHLQGNEVRFEGRGVARVAYLVLLVTHVLGAIVNLPLVLRTLWLAHKGRWEAHKKWARWTLPLWLYVSVTGVAVYLVLYVY